MKKVIPKLIIIALGLFFFNGEKYSLLAQENKIIAVVGENYAIWNYDIINREKYLSIINKAALDIKMQKQRLQEVLLNQLISRYLVLQEAKKYSYTISSAEVVDAMVNLEKRLNINSSDLINKAIKLGFSKEEFIQYFKNEMLTDKFKQEFALSRTKVSQNEIQREMDKFLSLNGKQEYHIYQIFISSLDKSQKLAEDTIALVAKQVNSKNFQTIANNFSEDLQGKKGGELGWIAESYLGDREKEEIVKLKVGEVSKPIKVSGGYKIYMLEGVRPLLQLNPANQTHMDQLRGLVINKLTMEKAQVVLEDFLAELYANNTITINN